MSGPLGLELEQNIEPGGLEGDEGKEGRSDGSFLNLSTSGKINSFKLIDTLLIKVVAVAAVLGSLHPPAQSMILSASS